MMLFGIIAKPGKHPAVSVHQHGGSESQEPLRSALQQKNASKKKNVTDRSWKAASPMKSSACSGDYYGTLGGAIPYEPGTVEASKKKGEIKGTPKNIVTGPSKKGG